MKEVRLLLILFSLYLLTGCGGDNTPETPPSPVASKLIFPYENSLCNVGTNVTGNESTISFEWEAGVNADKYELNIKNLNDGTLLTCPVTTNSTSVKLTRGAPYSWYVVSISNSSSEKAQSAIWKFYIAGDGVSAYSPFPAEIISPAMAAKITTSSSVITLDWDGSDIDGDITGYDVYFGTTATPGIYKSDIKETILNDVAIVSGNTYYWKVITKDSKGNKSDSGLYEFRIL